MQSKEEKVKSSVTPIHREIRSDAPPADAPGEAGAAALATAALHQLNRCAEEIEAFVKASQMERIVEGIKADLNEGQPPQPPRMRIRRD